MPRDLFTAAIGLGWFAAGAALAFCAYALISAWITRPKRGTRYDFEDGTPSMHVDDRFHGG